jgi:hypothetical protein
MSEEKVVNAKDEKPARERSSRSVMGPVLLIAVGVLFLLDNLNVLPPPNWLAALRFWPLLLIFIGLNVLAVQARPPLGTTLSLLLTLAALAVFGYLLLAGAPGAVLSRLGVETAAPELREQTFEVGLDGATSADVTLNLSRFPTTVAVLEDGDQLIAGRIATYGAVDVQPSSDASGRVEVEVGEEGGGTWFLDPRTWVSAGGEWDIRLNPDTPTDLHIDAGNASATAQLEELTLTSLTLDAGNGGVTAALPPGEYDIRADGGNGSLRVTLPDGGGQELRLDGGNGGVTILLPENVAARVEYNEGNGDVAVDDRFERVSGDNDEGVYETTGYEDATGHVLMYIDSGNGSVTIAAP